jgi:hypothetical protein
MEKSLKKKLMNEALSLSLRTNTEILIRELSRFNYKNFNHKPTANAWSAGEIAEHLLLFDIRTETVFAGKTVASDRDPQQQVEAISTRLGNRENKIDAPAPLIPSATAKEPEALIEKIRKQRSVLMKLVEQMDLTRELPDFPHRLFGALTPIEWINLTILHCERHIKQLKELKLS